MKSKNTGHENGRVELQWRADRHDGFQKATLIYDDRGRLVAVDYEPAKLVMSAPAGSPPTIKPA